MTKITLEQIKKLRQTTKAGVMDCKKALEESQGNEKKALAYLRKKGIARAEKRTGREVKSGLIQTYSHAQGQVVAVVELNCETDFVAQTDEFKNLARELAMQVAAMTPANADELLKQAYIRNEKILVSDLVKEVIGKIGENIIVRRIARFELGK